MGVTGGHKQRVLTCGATASPSLVAPSIEGRRKESWGMPGSRNDLGSGATNCIGRRRDGRLTYKSQECVTDHRHLELCVRSKKTDGCPW